MSRENKASMITANDVMSIIRADDNEFVQIPLPGSCGIFTKIIKVDEVQNQVVLQVRFMPNSWAPRHFHHCRAIAYTISGEWEYDEGKFGPGDVAYEVVGNEHTPRSEKGGEIILILKSDDGRFLDNYMQDGSVIRYTMDTFKFFAGKKQEDFQNVSLSQLLAHIEFIPSPKNRPIELYSEFVQELRG